MLKPTDGSGEKLKLWMFNAPDPSSRTVTPMDASEKGETRAKNTENQASSAKVSGPRAAERQRGAHAAELLFGRGSRADPNVRSRKP